MSDFTSIRAVLFDAVGTLLYADPPVVDVYHLAGWQHGSQLTREEIAQRLPAIIAASFDPQPEAQAIGSGTTLDACASGRGLNDLGRPPTSEAHERRRWRQIVAGVFTDVPDPVPLFRTLWDHFAQPEHWRLFHDVPLVLNTLVKGGLTVGIVSNFDRRLVRIRDAHPPLRLCERCFVSSEIGFSKPDPRLFSVIARQLGLAPDELLLIGDDWTNDIVGAQAAGWRAVFLDRGSKSGRQSIGSLSELLPLLDAR